MSDQMDVLAVQQLVARFANSFDLKDWSRLSECFTDELDTDYSDLRGTPPERMGREHFVDLRRSALQSLQTHHLGGNVEISLAGDSGEARVSMMIFRRSSEGEILNTHCLYTFGLTRTESGWRIRSIVQKVLLRDGDPRIHTGIVKK